MAWWQLVALSARLLPPLAVFHLTGLSHPSGQSVCVAASYTLLHVANPGKTRMVRKASVDTIACDHTGRAYGDLSPPASIMLSYLNIAIPIPFLRLAFAFSSSRKQVLLILAVR